MIKKEKERGSNEDAAIDTIYKKFQKKKRANCSPIQTNTINNSTHTID
jgi:hypothetical protein